MLYQIDYSEVMNAEHQDIVTKTLAQFQTYPFAKVPVQLFLNNTDPRTRVVTPSENFIVAQATWEDPRKEAERVAILFGNEDYNNKRMALMFYGGWIKQESPSLLERLYQYCAEKHRLPDDPELSLEPLRSASNYPLELCLKIHTSFGWLHLTDWADNKIWILERAIEAIRINQERSV